jgi:hypothetical protein
MKTCVIALTGALLQFASFGRADAQGVDGLRIFVLASIDRTDGGNRGGTAAAIDPDPIQPLFLRGLYNQPIPFLFRHQ